MDLHNTYVHGLGTNIDYVFILFDAANMDLHNTYVHGLSTNIDYVFILFDAANKTVKAT